MWPAGRGQGGKGVSREHGVKPEQQVNGRAARGLTDWRGAEGPQGDARKHRRLLQGPHRRRQPCPP